MASSRCCPLQNSFGVSILSPPSSPHRHYMAVWYPILQLLSLLQIPFLFIFSMLFPPAPRTSHPLLQLLGLSDQELQEQMSDGHSYAFNMGNNNIIPFQDFMKAAKVLMERNMSEVLHNRQMEAVFMPETHLPNMPRMLQNSSSWG